MDLDALASARHDDWQRLDALSRSGRLDGEGADELIERYQAAASDLSLVQATAGSTALGDRLSVSLARARLRFTGAPENPLRQLSRFALVQLPAALYRVRWLTLAVAVATVVVAGLYAAWALSDPRVLANVGTEEELRQIAEEGFVAYYSENPAASFAGAVWTNNAWIAAQCVAFGITGVWVPWVILQNAQNVGITAAVMFAYDEADTFFLYIAPHGLLELTCVFVAAAAGLRIFWAWVAPGARTRGQALAEDARALFT
ncbi:MAG TPA: stage II sporulation protein M, partial [Agromyces sp.]